MRTYEKIETIFARDMDGTKKLQPDVYRNETIQYLANNNWEWTEKIDGTNIRVYWDGHSVSFGGRTDSAIIPAELMNKLNELFGGETNAQMFEQVFGDKEVILFGEGYGRKIQKVGSSYIPDGVDFILFDVLIGDNYQPRTSVEQIAKMFGIKAIPVIGYGNLIMACRYVKTHPLSTIAKESCEMEGLVCRPMVEMRDRCGNRIIVKIKYCDMKDLNI